MQQHETNKPEAALEKERELCDNCQADAEVSEPCFVCAKILCNHCKRSHKCMQCGEG